MPEIQERWPLRSKQSPTGINGGSLWSTWTRSGTNATVRDSNGYVVTVAADTPRYEHDENGNGLGLLLEQSKTENMSSAAQQDLSSTYWSHTQCTRSAGGAGLSPDGTTNADSFYDDNSGSGRNPYITENVTAGASQTDCYSIFAKLVTEGTSSDGWVYLEAAAFTGVTAVGYYNIKTGVLGSLVGSQAKDHGMIPYGNGWYRIWISWSNESDTAGAFRPGLTGSDGSKNYLADGKEVGFWFPQAEDSSQGQGNGPSSVCVGNRNSDTIGSADISGWYSSGTGMSGLMEVYRYGERMRTVSIFEMYSSFTNTFQIRADAAFRGHLDKNGDTSGDMQTAAFTDENNRYQRMAWSITSNDAMIASENDLDPLTSDPSVTWPPTTEYDTVGLGTSQGGFTWSPGPSGLIIGDIVIYDDVSTDAELITLATNGLEYTASFSGTVAGDGGHIWPPRANDPRWTQILADSGITETGNFMDDVKAALIALSGASGGSLDDLWKRTLAAGGVTDTSEPYLY